MASGSGGGGRQRNEDASILDGSWLWVTLPVGVLVLIAALWYLIIAPGGKAPPRVTPTPAITATPWPTVTPMVVVAPTETVQPTAAATPKPTTIAIGARVQVAGTGASKLRVRQGPGTNTATLRFVPDGTQFVVVDGPTDANGFTWWKIDDQNGLVGWAAVQYLQLVP